MTAFLGGFCAGSLATICLIAVIVGYSAVVVGKQADRR